MEVITVGLDIRKLRILQAIIDDYIISAEPVGSRTIERKYDLGISSATIRNEMADLEELGYLEQPYTSAGRIPSDKGYRLYVDKLMRSEGLSITEAKLVKDNYEKKAKHIEQIIHSTTKIISDITNYTSLVLGPKFSKVMIKHIQLVPMDNKIALLVVVTNTGIVKDEIINIPEGINNDYLLKISYALKNIFQDKNINEISFDPLMDMLKGMERYREFFKDLINILSKSISMEESRELYLGGTANILNFPEYHDLIKAKEFFNLVEEKELFLKQLLDTRDSGLIVTIGEENEYEQFKDCSIVTTSYSIDGRVFGTIGLIGPTRMDYGKAMSFMGYLGKTLNTYLSGFFD